MLCKKSHDNGHIAIVSTEAVDFVAQKGITGEKSVCFPCRADVHRVLRDPSYIPRWEKQTTSCVKNCNEVI